VVTVIVGGYSTVIHKPDLLLLSYIGVVPSKVTTAPHHVTSLADVNDMEDIATGSNSIVLARATLLLLWRLC
jgi:hypothetical protein